MKRTLLSGLLMTVVLMLAAVRPAPAAPLSVAAFLAYMKELSPLRAYETFPFTEAEYRQVGAGEAVFKGREVPGTPLLEGGVARIVNQPAWKIWRAVVDEEHHREYMPQLYFSTVVRGKATGRLIFDYLEIPIVSDRQWIVEAKHWGELWQKSGGRIWLATFKSPANQQAIIDEALRSGRLPPSIREKQEDAVTLRESRASYTLIELPDGRTLVEYRAFSDPAGKIPARLLNLGAPSTAKELVELLEERAQKADKHFATPNHPVIFDPLDRPMGLTRPTP